MFRSKSRSTIASLAAALAVAATMAPAASAAPVPVDTGLGESVTQAPGASTDAVARPNDGRFKKSAEALRKAHAAACADMYLIFDANVDEAMAAGQKNDMKGVDKALENANKAYEDSKQIGCSWAP